MMGRPPMTHLDERTRCARLVRETLGVLASKWKVDVLLALGDGTRRYHELLGALDPISEKVLTQTLRALERDGLIGRRVHAEVPPRVEYALTPLGATLAGPMRAMAQWGVVHGRRVEEARERFDGRRAPPADRSPPHRAARSGRWRAA
jgi:DNA-binding HxlR family transcriptional regulator